MPEDTRERRRTGRKLTTEMLAEIDASLTDIDWRLLHWLLRYPLQRTDDLVIGVARWTSRATVYRHLQGLAAQGLIESVLPKTPGAGKRVFYLSNAGLHLLARYLERPARELTRGFQADEAGLLRLLPRLPTLLLLQEVVNGLVTYTAQAMTSQGRKPRLVRWTWQREVTHRFVYREQAMRLFAEGAVALYIRTQQPDGSPLDQWYGLFILFTELHDERLMRLRLQRLLCWRESAERWSSYQHMLPVLILARSPRQCEHWQQAVETTALQLRLGPLAGALACLPSTQGAHMNPWVLNWRTLSSDVFCHLQDLLRPLPRAAFPSSFQLEEGEEAVRHARSPSQPSVATGPSGTPARLSRLVRGNLAHRMAHITQDDLEEQEVQEMLALLGLRLTPCQWSILHLLLAHPLLSDEELAAVLNLQRRSVRCSLYELHQLRCLEPIRTDAEKRWHFCARGLHLIAAANHMPVQTMAEVSDVELKREASPLVQRGEAWLFHHSQHTAGIYGFFARLARDARQEAGHALCWWETGAACERRYRVGEQWYNLRPDALAAYRVGQQQRRFWLEWDRGTMNGRDLSIKFAAYAHYVVSREWARERSRLPFLVCVTPDIAQEQRMQRVAQAILGPPLEWVVWTTTQELLNESGPLASIWLPSVPRRRTGATPGGWCADQQRGTSRRSALPIVIESTLPYTSGDA